MAGNCINIAGNYWKMDGFTGRELGHWGDIGNYWKRDGSTGRKLGLLWRKAGTAKGVWELLKESWEMIKES